MELLEKKLRLMNKNIIYKLRNGDMLKILLLGAPTTDGYKAIGLNRKISGGGWVENLILSLKQTDDLDLNVLFYCNCVKEVSYSSFDGVTYIALPERVKSLKKCNKAMVKDLNKVLNKIKPNVVHNIGTEREHNYQLLKLVGKEKTLVSLTGLVSIIKNHYFAGMQPYEYKRISLGDFLRRTSLIKQKRYFSKWGKSEQSLIKEAKYIMGRTNWDRAVVKQLNPSVDYIHCGELLNKCFSVDKWSVANAEAHTIFVSQGSYPLKGIHMLLKAMPLILSKHPNAKIIVGGPNIIGDGSFISKIKKTTYASYLTRLIKKYSLNEHISFTGPLTADQMKMQFLKCNVFVMPSSVENSPNSLGEAMSLGVPIVASYVGGIPDMVEHKKSALLYGFYETHLLAHYICNIFENNDLALSLGNNAIMSAKKLFNPKQVIKTTLDTYYKIFRSNEHND